MKTPLYPFQQELVDKLAAKLQDAPWVTKFPIQTGYGKTYIACALADRVFPKTVSVFVPITLIHQWELVIAREEITNLKINKVNTNYLLQL